MNKTKCKWVYVEDGEFTTECSNEYQINEYDNEELLQGLLFTFCPYCGKKIEQQTAAVIQNG